MSGGWAKGDLALCVRSVDGEGLGDSVAAGSIHTVTTVVQLRGELGLTFIGLNHGRTFGYAADCFRKIHPLTSSEHRQALAEIERVREVVL